MAVLESPEVEDDAFERLCREHGPALLALCRSRLGAAGRDDAEDACQEALIRAYRALPTFDRERELWPWLATIAANVCTDIHRRRRAEPLPPGELARHHEPLDPDELVAARMRSQAVSSAIKALPHQYRRQVYLADVAGWSYADIADHERTTVASVRSSLLRGRKALRTRMHELSHEGRLWTLPVLAPVLRLRRRAHPVATAEVHSLLPCLPTLAQAAAAAVAVMAMVSSGADTSAASQPTRVASSSAMQFEERVEAAGGSASVHARGPVLTEQAGDDDDAETTIVDGPGARVGAASDVETEGPWRVVHVEVNGEAAGLPFEGGATVEYFCNPNDDDEFCKRTEASLRPLVDD